MSTDNKVREKAPAVRDRPARAVRSLKELPGARAISRATFPWTAPTWPDSISRPPPKRSLGVDYDTAWARSYGARLARVVVTETMTRPVAHLLANPQIEGLDRLEQLDEPVIFAANHASHVDTPLLLSVLPERWRHRTVVAAGADYFFDRRWKAAFFAFVINAIPIERLRVNRRSIDLAASLLAEDWSLLIFPEGGRTPDGWGQTHSPGTAWLAQRTGRTVVPVYVQGTRKMLPRHGSRLRPATTHITFGAPIRPSAEADPRQLAARIERALAVLAEEQVTDWWTARRHAASGRTPALTGPAGGAWRRSWALADRDGSGGTRRRTEPRWPRL
ncbi:MAG TPA: lysophospholipid acyltransferase family protein [Acidimicrobiales bacterium]|jgi:1-acyl-sn-glycerol-3-phosphate acyltransferase|nr:lysophospholipid acyltransferase family protein [Acidimicrobiales bacterium]